MRKQHHPNDRAARRRSAEAKALEKLKPKRINAKKRQIITDLKDKEAEDELRIYRTDQPGSDSQPDRDHLDDGWP